MLTRRELLAAGGGLAAALALPLTAVGASEVIEITMGGREDGSHVWFDPIGILIKPETDSVNHVGLFGQRNRREVVAR